jgi:spore coat protein U-like protein
VRGAFFGIAASLALWFGASSSANAGCLGVACSCSIGASPISFGTYVPTSSANTDVASTISVKCNSFIVGLFISYDVTLGPSLYGTTLNRRLSNGSSLLSYNLYTNAARSTVWGDGTGGTGKNSFSYTLTLISSRTDTFTAYGRLPGSQNVSAGSYSDTIVATVIF